jgi:hypothetical protein
MSDYHSLKSTSTCHLISNHSMISAPSIAGSEHTKTLNECLPVNPFQTFWTFDGTATIMCALLFVSNRGA